MKLIDKIREMAARLGTMARNELDEFANLVTECWNEYDAAETTPENLEVINELVAYTEQVMARQGEIDAADAKAAEDKARARDAISKLKGEAGGDGTDGGTDGDTGGTDGDGDAAVEGAEAALAASTRRPVTPLRAGDVAAHRGPRIQPIANNAVRPALVAAGNVGSKQAREEFTDIEDLARTTADVLRGLPKDAANGKVVIASARWLDQYDESRRLRAGDSVGNMLKIDRVARPQAIMASGGIPLPVNVDYRLETWTNANRPIRDFLVTFGADHGGLTYRNPATVGALAGAQTVWTEATDANPGGATKAVYSVTVPATDTEYVDAVATRVKFGNLMGQFDPDLVAMNTELALASAARTAELNLLTRLEAKSTRMTQSASLGAARSIFATLELVAANFRWTNRLDDTVPLAVMLPAFVKNMIRADRLLELAHDGSNPDPFIISDQWIEDAFKLRNIRPCFFDDGLPAQAGLPAYVTQNFGAFTANAAVPAWPTEIVWFMFIDGSVQFLDGGRLDLGVVRDATLDATNDYETFVETFEGLAYRGFSLGALEVVHTIAVNGESASTATA